MGKKSERSAPSRAALLLQAIARDALAGCDPARAVARAARPGPDRLTLCGRPIHLQKRGRLLVVAYGKAAPRMVEGLAQSIRQAGGRRPVRGLLIAPREPRAPRADAQRPETKRPADTLRLTPILSGHPIPDRASFTAGSRALRLLSTAGAGDDVIFLASGGGSALMAASLAPLMKPEEKAALHRLLITSGAPIGTINAVRKHLSAVKGGRLAVAARRAKSQTTLVLCDVDPERYEEVASGPSLPDRTTLDDLILAIDHYGMAPALPVRVLEALHTPRFPETPKPRDPVFRQAKWEMVLSNRDLRGIAVRVGLTRGLSAEAVPSELTGPVEEAVEIVARAIEAAPPGMRLLVLGGEVLTAPGKPGQGGRAQEFALRLALRMAGLGSRPWSFLALGSDGIDGNSPAAGAFVDATSLERARRAGIDPDKVLREAQTYRLFKKLGDDFVTGPTGTNVRDLYLLLTGAQSGGEGRPIRTATQDRPPYRPGSGS
jgi:glycerate 2-kinase